MSASFTVGQSSEFDKLLALAMFVQTPEYQDRVKELRDLEAAAKASTQEATNAVASNNEALRQVCDERQKHLSELQSFNAERNAYRADLAKREQELQSKLADITKRESALERETASLSAKASAKDKAQAEKDKQLTARETSVKYREDHLAQERAVFELQRARIEKAYRGD